jgi:hypothetical protein
MKPRATGGGFSPCPGCLAPSRCADCVFAAAVADGFRLREKVRRLESELEKTRKVLEEDAR